MFHLEDIPVGKWLVTPMFKPWSSAILNGSHNPILMGITKTGMTMENQLFEEMFPMKHRDFPASHVSFGGCIYIHIWNVNNHLGGPVLGAHPPLLMEFS